MGLNETFLVQQIWLNPVENPLDLASPFLVF
jgi:hypothetical protein